MTNIQMTNGTILPKEKIDKLVGFIINKFAEEGLSVDEAKIVIDGANELIGEFSVVKPYRFFNNISCNE